MNKHDSKIISNKWVSAFNKVDADLVTEFYSADAINHRVTNEPIEVKEAIKDMFSAKFTQSEMVFLIENIFKAGDWDRLSFLRLHDLPIPQE